LVEHVIRDLRVLDVDDLLAIAAVANGTVVFRHTESSEFPEP
jgi:hypothetical protein